MYNVYIYLKKKGKIDTITVTFWGLIQCNRKTSLDFFLFSYQKLHLNLAFSTIFMNFHQTGKVKKKEKSKKKKITEEEEEAEDEEDDEDDDDAYATAEEDEGDDSDKRKLLAKDYIGLQLVSHRNIAPN